MEINEDHKNWSKRMARRKWNIKEHCHSSFWIEKIKHQKGKCAITKAKLLFDVEYGKAPCHPLYASVDHIVPGSEDGGLQIVCYDCNDLKGHMPKPLFEALQKTDTWKEFIESWQRLAEKKSEKREIFKMLVKLGEPLKFIETTRAAEGVERDVYKFTGDASRDLGIIRIDAGCKTPLQKVLKGDKTIEGYIFGRGRLVVTAPDGKEKIYNKKKGLAVDVKIGELMQWQAADDANLEVYEICFPPYADGRFQNLE